MAVIDTELSNELRGTTSGIFLRLRKALFINPIVKEFIGYVLDVGCRDGLYLESYPGKSLGIDISDYWVEECKRKGLNVLQADAETFVQENTFDTVLLSHLLEHLDQPSKALANAYRSTKPGGKIIITVPRFKVFLHGFNDLSGHKQFISAEYVDHYLSRGCRKVKSSIFPFSDELPFLGKYQELRLIYQKE